MATPLLTEGAFIKTIASTAAPEAIAAAPFKVYSAIIQALPTNTGSVQVGDLAVDYTTGLGVRLAKPVADGTPASLVLSSSREGSREVDLSKYFVDVQVNGEGVSVLWSNS